MHTKDVKELTQKIINAERVLFIQDLDGVCIGLVKDPLTRQIDSTYVQAVESLKESFYVLTNGEHEGKRGVNRLVEKAIGSRDLVKEKGLYLPGLAAGGVQFQDKFGTISHPGITEEEKDYLSNLPRRMESKLIESLERLIPDSEKEVVIDIAKRSILDTELSPTINLNQIFNHLGNNVGLKIKIQQMLEKIMGELLEEARIAGLNNSFFLHIAPNLGKTEGRELIKYAVEEDVGTTDIQFMINGAVKERGLLVLLNKYILSKTGIAPFGDYFNARETPKSNKELIDLCKRKIPKDIMPLLVGVGDTVTSTKLESNKGWVRGGSDRGFLELIQELGKEYQIDNQIILVDSSGGEVDRPSLKDGNLIGISDPEDTLHFSAIFESGPAGYIEWFSELARLRTT